MDADLALDRLTTAEGRAVGDCEAAADHILADALRTAIQLQAPQTRDGSRHACGMAMVATVLWSRFLRFDQSDAHWPDRDRFVVAATRFAPLLRGLLTLCSEPEPEIGDNKAVRAPLPVFGQHPGVEMAIGPAGQGIASAAGMAMAERMLAQRFGHSLIDHRTWVLACETDLSAGVALEAASLAGQMRLDRLTVLFELDARDAAHGLVQRGDGGEAAFEPMARFAASGWSVRRVDASDPEAIAQAIAGATRGRKPTLIACVVNREADPTATPPGIVSLAAHTAWRDCGHRGNTARRAWLKRLARHRHAAEFERAIAGRLPSGWRRAWREAWHQGGQWAGGAPDAPPPEARPPESGLPESAATPDSCGAQRGIAALLELLPEFVTLSCQAGLPRMPQLGRVERSLRLGTQEHGMAAVLNGIALHGGLLACGSASFIAVDRMRPALRLGALMGRQVIHLLTHDGLALGEDGAAWQPVEQLASLRAMPNVAVFRPADGTEMMECWQLALHRTEGPSLIAFSSGAPLDLRADLQRRRQDGIAAPPDLVAGTPLAGNACARGGYVFADVPQGSDRRATLIATGPEIGIALQARALLARLGIHAAIVSLPCWELFAAQSSSYREAILGRVLRVGIEAASEFGWERWLGPDGIFIGIDDFGISAAAGEIYRQFGITPEAVAERIRRRLGVRNPVRMQSAGAALAPGREQQ